jgi:pentatricopeptide repeat protein
MRKIALLFVTAILFTTAFSSCRDSKETSETEELIEEMREEGAEIDVKTDGDEKKIKMETDEKEVKIKTEEGETKIKVETDDDNS